jgi:hypothetical protein
MSESKYLGQARDFWIDHITNIIHHHDEIDDPKLYTGAWAKSISNALADIIVRDCVIYNVCAFSVYGGDAWMKPWRDVFTQIAHRDEYTVDDVPVLTCLAMIEWLSNDPEAYQPRIDLILSLDREYPLAVLLTMAIVSKMSAKEWAKMTADLSYEYVRTPREIETEDKENEE